MRIPEIKTVACLGAGTMGHGIAFLAAKVGYTIRLFARSNRSLTIALAGVERLADFFEDNGLPAQEPIADILGRVQGVTDIGEAADGADLIIESVAEDLATKHRVLAEAESRCRPGALIGTNTSSLSPSAIGQALQRPERFLSIHFFNPSHLMPLVEICPTDATRPEACALAARWVESLGNVPVTLRQEVPGFIVNRIQSACLREALHIVEQGWADAATVDAAVALSLGRRYAVTGPIESADMGGLDVFSAVLAQLCPDLGKRTGPGPLMRQAVEQGNLGLKTGHGVYKWPPEHAAERRAARERVLLDFLKRDRENPSQ